jgi:hypothetical protein
MSGFRTTPNLGPALDTVYTAMPFWDAQLGVSNGGVANAEASYRLGNVGDRQRRRRVYLGEGFG